MPVTNKWTDEQRKIEQIILVDQNPQNANNTSIRQPVELESNKLV